MEPTPCGTSEHISSYSRTSRRSLRGILRGTSQLIQIFYNSFSTLNRTSIDTTCGGTIRKKSPNEVYVIIEDITSNTYHYSSSDKHVT
ncbi:hypothetical protein CR513_12346, partial [Mucuna pruriens]